MNGKKLVGLALGALGFCLPLVFDIPGLSFPGQVTLGIFLMAACFWVTEPVPIYTTSLLVILLEVLLLSAEGPLCLYDAPATASIASAQAPGGAAGFALPAEALQDDKSVFLSEAGIAPKKIEVQVLDRSGEQVIVQGTGLSAGQKVLTEPKHWLTAYKPTPYRNFFGALADPIIILFMGGCLLADASVKYSLDRSLTRLFLRPVGTNPRLIVLGLLLATAVLSAFMSNTATTAMMMTVVLPILAKLPVEDPIRRAVVLAIPIGANIGGIATPIGTPPNAIALAAVTKQGMHLPFATWCVMALPIVLLTLFLSWVILIKLFPSAVKEVNLDLTDKFNRSAHATGLYIVFGLTAVLWFTENQHGISSNIVAFLPVVALPLFGIIGKKEIHALPWDVLWLMGGGISLGTAIKDTGLAQWMVGQVSWSSLSGFAILCGLALFSFGLANFLSHTVTVTLLAPIAISVGTAAAIGEDFNLLVTMVAVAVASSYGMTLPISTPPNAIAMGSGAVQTRDMIKAGGLIGVIGMALVLLLARYYWPWFVR